MRQCVGAGPGVIRRSIRAAALVGLVLAGAGGSLGLATPASAQGVVGGDRSPAFLMASTTPSRPPTRIDASRVPVLRRRISLALRDVTMEQALKAIERASGLAFAYSKTTTPLLNRVVRLDARELTVAAVLTDLLLDTGLDVVLSLKGTRAMLVRRDSGERQGELGVVSGRVTAKETGAPLAGASVLLALADTALRTTTSDSGTFVLRDVPAGRHAITVRHIGFRPLTKQVVVDSLPVEVAFVLEAAAVALNDLVSTATGLQRRRDIGNAITTIRADSVLQSAPIRNLTDLLANRVPGLTVQHTSGAPGDPAKLRLRGLGSALRSNDPVVIVDGVRVYATQSDARSGNLTNLDPGTSGCRGSASFCGAYRANPVDVPAPSPLDQIDPNIIEKIEVFKGPSAATLYGADAANGVIVITTKRGRPGPTRWSASFEQRGTSSPRRYPTGYYRWGHDSATGAAPLFCTLRDVLCVQDSLVQFQALNDSALTLLGHGHGTALSLSASGGAQALTYSITGSYGAETGLLTLPAYEVARFRTLFNRDAPDWMQRPHRLETWSVTSNITARLGSSADITLSTSLGRSEQRRTSLEQQLAPMAGTYVDKVNGLYYRPGVIQDFTNVRYFLDPTSAVLSSYYTQQTASSITFTTGLNAQWRPRSWFSASGQAGLNVIPRDDHLILPAGLVSATDSGMVVRGTGRSLVSTFNVQGELRKPLGRGFVFTTSVGANLKTENTSDVIGSAAGLTPGTSSLSGATHIGAAEQASNTSVYGWYLEPRISGQRLSLSTGLRLDGGSTYGARVTTGGVGLPKLNGSWVISEEPWFPFKAAFSSLRLRGAYGQAQVQPGAADRLRLYAGSPESALFLTTLGNTDLRPERSTEFEGGFDADLLDSRLSVEFSAYRKLQVDALMNISLPGSVGAGGSIGLAESSVGSTVLTNIGNIRNTGMEVVLRLTPVRRPAFTWSAELNYNRNNNILTKLGHGVAPNKQQGLVEGYPVYSRWARPILGYADQNGDGVLQYNEIQVGDSLVFMGRLYPAYTTSLFTNIALFNGVVGITAGFDYNSGALQIDQTAKTNWVLARALVDPSVPLDQQAAVWTSTQSDPNTAYGVMQSVSTFRFNSLAVNYRAPSSVARFIHAQQMAVAVQGSNLGLHSTYRGKDPDVNAWSPGENIVDTGQLPQPRTWQLRVSLTY